jgi:hypothetical protein
MPNDRSLPRVLIATAFVAASVLVTSQSFLAQEPENDDASARRRATYAWYNDSAPDPSPGRGRYGHPFSPGYQRFLNDAAARERARYGTMLPSLTGSSAAIGSATTPGEWTNLGPTHADFLKNGSYVLEKTDTGRVRTIITLPGNSDLIYVAFAAGGVWRSTNAGTSWAPITETLGTLSVGSLAVDPGNGLVLYLGLGDPFDGTGIGLVKSIDGGDTWSAPVYLGDSRTISQVVVSAINSNLVLAATDKGLYRSTDAGATWSLVPLATGQPAPAIYTAWSIAAAESRLLLSIEANALATSGTTDGQIWYSDNNGVTWLRGSGVSKRGGVGRITIASAPRIRRWPTRWRPFRWPRRRPTSPTSSRASTAA